MLASGKLKRDWREFSFSHLIHLLELVEPKQKRNQWSVSGFSWEKERKERERGQCKWPQKRESHVCDQMSPNVMGQSRERISDIRKDIRPDNRSDEIIIYSDQFSGLILHSWVEIQGLSSQMQHYKTTYLSF